MAELNNEVHDTLQTDWSDFTHRVGGYNQYEDGHDPDTVLRRGLMEEAHEMWLEHGTSDQASEYLKGEVGDVLYYIAHTAQRNGIPKLETNVTVTPVFEVTDAGIRPVDNALDVALVHIIRINDVLRPRNDSLWIIEDGSSQRSQDLKGVLESTITALKQFADKNDFTLTEAMKMTADKLDTRARKPHVIEEQQKEKSLTSTRERAVSGLTRSALRSALVAELAMMHEQNQ